MSQDHREAVRLYRSAAEQGNATAQSNLGFMYYNGMGVPQDHREAVRLYRSAAEQGNATAQFNLGLMYSNGEGVPQNYIRAHMWFNLAAAGGHKEAGELRAIVAKLMTTEQISDAQSLAREWIEKHQKND